jgi:hypothetical protein
MDSALCARGVTLPHPAGAVQVPSRAESGHLMCNEAPRCNDRLLLH